jgi:predicted PurR-regulated permease PerM
MIGQPVMRFFQNKVKIGKFRPGPELSAGLTLLVFFIGVGLLLLLCLPPIFTQINNLSHVDYAAIAKTLEKPLLDVHDTLAKYGVIDPSVSVEKQLKNTLSNSFEPRFIKDSFASVISAAGNIGVGIGSVVFITFFFLQEKGMLAEFVADLLPAQYDDKVKSAFQDIAKNLSLYFRGLLLEMLGFAMLVTVALLILGVKNALLIGFFAGLLNIIPYVGPIIGALFGVMFTISSNLDLEFYSQIMPMIIKVVCVFVGAQLIDNNILQPLIFSSTLKTHPLEIFFVVMMGAKVGGVMGMVLAIPVYTILRVIAAVFLSEFHIVQNLRQRKTT